MMCRSLLSKFSCPHHAPRSPGSLVVEHPSLLHCTQARNYARCSHAGQVVDYRTLLDASDTALAAATRFITLQRLRVLVDVSPGINLYPTLRLVQNSPGTRAVVCCGVYSSAQFEKVVCFVCGLFFAAGRCLARRQPVFHAALVQTLPAVRAVMCCCLACLVQRRCGVLLCGSG